MDELIKKLLEQTDSIDTGRTLTGTELGELIRERGLEDAGELIPFAGAGELQRVLDDDLWRSDAPGEAEAFDAKRFAQWIEVLAESDAGEAAARLVEMEEDLVAFGLSRIVRVFDLYQVALAGWAALLNQDLEEVMAAEPSVEIDRWVIFSLGYDGWTELTDVLLALADDHGDLFERLMRRCEEATQSDLIERSEREGSDALNLEQEGAEDAADARDQRRTAEGYVGAADATAFLALAAQSDVGDDAITRAHLGRLVERAGGTASEALADGRLEAALGALDDELRGARQRELAFLANVLVSAGEGGQALRPVEAAELAFAVCALGWSQGGGDLRSTSLVRWFGRGWKLRRPSSGRGRALGDGRPKG